MLGDNNVTVCTLLLVIRICVNVSQRTTIFWKLNDDLCKQCVQGILCFHLSSECLDMG